MKKIFLILMFFVCSSASAEVSEIKTLNFIDAQVGWNAAYYCSVGVMPEIFAKEIETAKRDAENKCKEIGFQSLNYFAVTNISGACDYQPLITYDFKIRVEYNCEQ